MPAGIQHPSISIMRRASVPMTQGSSRHFPGTRAILNIMKDLGSGLDCSSYTELEMAARIGFQGSDIMFSSNDTPAEDSILARNLNVAINFDDISHIAFFIFTKCNSVESTPLYGRFYAFSPDSQYSVQWFPGIPVLSVQRNSHPTITSFLSSNAFSAYAHDSSMPDTCCIV